MGGLAQTAKLIASLTLQDKMSPGLAKAAAGIDKLDNRMTRLGKTVGSGLNAAARNVAKIGVATGGFIASQIAFGIKSLGELERVTNQTNAVIESTGGKAGVSAVQIREMAEALEEVTTADDKAIQAGENLLLTFTNIGSKTFPRATEAMVDMAIALAGGDVAAANFDSAAIQLGKALNDPIKGITALSRVGVSFTKQQKDQIKAMVEAGDVAGAQAVILRELETEFGKAGEAAGTGFEADMRRFGDAIEGAQQAIAIGMLPVIKEFTRFITQGLKDPKNLQTIKEIGLGVADAFRDILAFAQRIPWDQIADAMRLAGTGAKAALDFFTKLPPWVQTAVVTGWGLNKLTGGALGSIVSELGKGLVKGVLNMAAAVVNIKAGTVVGGGGAGIPGAGGGAAGAGAAAGAATIGAGVAVTTAAFAIADVVGKELNKVVEDMDLSGQFDTNLAPLFGIPSSINNLATVIGLLQQQQDKPPPPPPVPPVLNDIAQRQQRLGEITAGGFDEQHRQNETAYRSIEAARVEASRQATNTQGKIDTLTRVGESARSDAASQASATHSRIDTLARVGEAAKAATVSAVDRTYTALETSRATLGTKLDSVKTAVANQKLPAPIVNTTVTVAVSARDVQSRITTTGRYGKIMV